MELLKPNLWAAIAVAVCLLPWIAEADESLIGVIDYKRVQQSYFRTQLERKKLQEKREIEGQKLVEPVNRFQKMAEEQKIAKEMLDDPTLSMEKKRSTAEEARNRSAEMVELQSKTEKRRLETNAVLATHIAKVQTEIVSEINTAISNIAEAKKLAFVQNITFRSSGVPVFPFVSTKLTTDISEEVIAELNRKAPKDWKPESGIKDGE